MKLSERIKTYNFWVSLSSAIFLIIKVLGTQIGFDVDESLFSDLITSICSILVLLGIIVPPKYPELKLSSKNKENIDNEVVNDANNTPSNIAEECENTEEPKMIETEISQEIDTAETPLNEQLQTDSFIKNETIEIEDVDLDSANFNTENIDNNYLERKTESLELLKFNFEKELTSQEKLFENNLDDYVKLLENELNKIKSK